MSHFLVLVTTLFLMSFATFVDKSKSEHSSPGYQYGRQMDEKSMRAGFMERR
jgi:hypothetical protein